MNDTDAVAAPAETTPSTNTNPTPEASAPAEPQIFSPEEAQEIKRFLDGHGGFDRVKETVTRRNADAQPAPQAPQAPLQPLEAQPAPQATEPAQPTAQNSQPVQAPTPEPDIPKGFKTPTEIIAEVYNDRLEGDPKYESIKDYIHNGDYIKEMSKMGMVAFDKNGNANDAVIRQFLDLKAATIPAPAHDTPMTSTPIVEYTDTEGDVNDYNTALKIYQQGTGHPRYADAQKIISTHFNGAKSGTK